MEYGGKLFVEESGGKITNLKGEKREKYIVENSKIGFIPTASELDDDRWHMEKDRGDLIKMKNYYMMI